eukprot:TRINITY_DN758_c0_g1_i2.p1 TRINITY_DN758_c0_g1~~TRINITY_DN758_c0_g1_i2.p1  ORF type:complete len:435 (-),score=90.99 TRINITY_DN758_c0_g1_i2:52-1356(-)
MEVVELSQLLSNDIQQIELLTNNLTINGWSFIRMDHDLSTKALACGTEMESFFLSETSVKNQYFSEPIFGYTSVPHKESFRWKSGSRYGDVNYPKPSAIFMITSTLDRIFEDLLKNCSSNLFNCNYEDLLNLKQNNGPDIPMLDQNATERWGLMDMARYYNKSSHIYEGGVHLNCVEHYDPGLLSLSVLSTAPGLQVKNMVTNEWVDCPYLNQDGSIAVMWCGEAVRNIPNCNLIPGIHRVKFVEGSHPRLALWHEVCTREQALDGVDLNQQVDLSNLTYEKKKHEFVVPTMNKDAPPLKAVERNYGMPVSKSGPIDFSSMNNGPPLNAVEGNYGMPVSKSGISHAPLKAVERNYGMPVSKSGISHAPTDFSSINFAPPLNAVERNYGMPVSKSGISHAPLKAVERNYGMPASKSRRPLKQPRTIKKQPTINRR